VSLAAGLLAGCGPALLSSKTYLKFYATNVKTLSLALFAVPLCLYVLGVLGVILFYLPYPSRPLK